MSRVYQYETHVMPSFTGGGTSGLALVGQRFLPGGASLQVSGLTGGSFSIFLNLDPAGGIGELYCDPCTGLTAFTANRVFQLPAFSDIFLAGAAVTGTVVPTIGAIAFSPYQ